MIRQFLSEIGEAIDAALDFDYDADPNEGESDGDNDLQLHRVPESYGGM